MMDDNGACSGYLFLCSSGARLTDFKEEFWSNFFFSACIMLLCASVLTSVLMRRLTDAAKDHRGRAAVRRRGSLGPR